MEHEISNWLNFFDKTNEDTQQYDTENGLKMKRTEIKIKGNKNKQQEIKLKIHKRYKFTN